jgi:hypothetical protein
MTEDEDADYVCSLDEETINRIKSELNENPADRLASVKALRKWINEQGSWLKSPTGMV